MSAHPPGASLHCEDAVGGGQRFSQSISGLIELFSTIGHKGAEYPGHRSVEQGAAQYSTVQYSTGGGTATSYLEVKRRGIIRNFELPARYSSLLRCVTLGGHKRVNGGSETILQHTFLSSRSGVNQFSDGLSVK